MVKLYLANIWQPIKIIIINKYLKYYFYYIEVSFYISARSGKLGGFIITFFSLLQSWPQEKNPLGESQEGDRYIITNYTVNS